MSFSTPQFPVLTLHDWLLWHDGVHAPAFNMAADHVLFDHAERFGMPLLRLYSWEQPTVSIGRSQRYPELIPQGLDVIRRPTGGGVVFHGKDCTYTLVLPADHPLSTLEIAESYQFIHEAFLSQFASVVRLSDTKAPSDPLTMRCFDSPVRFDLLQSDGTKCAGAAQLRRGGASLTQGSVLLSISGGNQKVMEQKILAAFEHLAHAQYVAWEPDADFLSEVSERVSSHYATEEWNRKGAVGRG